MNQFKGVYTALITPFSGKDQLDEEGLRLLIQRQITGNVNGVVLLGTTGETPTLSENEKKQIITIAKKECLQNTTLIIGTGSYSTKRTIEETLIAEKAGADGALIVTPYYNKPTQKGLYQHFKEVAETTTLPIIIYNIAGRTGQNLQTETLKRLIEIPSIVGIKEGSGSISQINEVIGLVRKYRPEFSVLSADDAITLPLMSLGGNGVISVISNIFPEEIKSLVEAINVGNYNLAQEIHYDLMPVINAAFIETNPIPIKAMHHFLGLPGGNCRLPLCDLCEENAVKVKNALNVARASWSGKL